ncbi:alpha/beta hydrolase [Actinomyces sp. oral taxon 171]|uniref:alpha/beta hydrolase n=1 Tax=Actinomyces sp. oral taxon 171 TaxID=706438 RepID=UPI0001F6209A|nr:TAP-like protein [Actinomyces sp. oral taxon 171 str. F0337]QCT34553.1 alpha/beta hydrolase [Actinomyces sp. oral taxon 171 str. F0337]
MPGMTRTVRQRPVDSGRAIAAQASAQSSMAGGSPRRRRTGIGVLAVLVGGCLSACGTGLAPAAGGSATVAGPIPSGLESFYRQAVNWYPCAATDGVEKASEKTAQASASMTAAATASAQATATPSSESATDATGTADSSEETDTATFSCAVITVPLDYANPKGETISIAVKKRAATGGHSQGALFINPGGPGDSGVSFAERAGNAFSPDLLSAYDIIGFDPRGVGSSTAITCSSDDDSSSSPAEPSATGTPSAGSTPSAGTASGGESYEEWAESTRQSFQELSKQCGSNTEPAALLDHVDTVSAARDLDILRALAGQEKLNYLGFSYGTYLASVYAETFPGNTGRIVLDGAIDPSLSLAEQGLGQAKGFEQALRTYVDYCQSSSGCPLSGGTDAGVQQIRDLITSANSTPLATGDPKRTVTGADIVTALSEYLYTTEQNWPPLTKALDQAINHRDGSAFAASEEQDSSSKDDGGGAFQAITCLDYPVEGDTTTWAAQYEQAKREAPIFADSAVGMDLVCSVWGHNGTRKPAQIHARGAAPILVVGTTGDPATPYAWSKSLAEQLDSGQLLTWEGNGHTAYGGDASCVNDAVDAYLISGTMPKKGLTCHGNE